MLSCNVLKWAELAEALAQVVTLRREVNHVYNNRPGLYMQLAYKFAADIVMIIVAL